MIRALGFSLWIGLVTVIPGLITIAAVAGAVWIFVPEITSSVSLLEYQLLALAFFAAIMLVTQSIGISLESLLIDNELLGHESVKIPAAVAGEATKVDPYEQYELLYFTLVSMGPEEDPNSHVERAVAQFFLSNNALVAFGAGLLATIGLGSWRALSGTLTAPMLWSAGAYVLGLVVFLIAVYRITRVRFRVMGKAIWTLRNHPSTNLQKSKSGP